MDYVVFQGFGLDPTKVFRPTIVKKYLKLKFNSNRRLYNEKWIDFVRLWSDSHNLQLSRPYYEYVFDQPQTQELSLIIPDPDTIVDGPKTMLYIPNPSIGTGSVTFMTYDTALEYLINGLVQIAQTRYEPHNAALPDLDDVQHYLYFYYGQYQKNLTDLTLITK